MNGDEVPEVVLQASRVILLFVAGYTGLALVVYCLGYSAIFGRFTFSIDRNWFITQYTIIFTSFAMAITSYTASMFGDDKWCSQGFQGTALCYAGQGLATYCFLYFRANLGNFGTSKAGMIIRKFILVMIFGFVVTMIPFIYFGVSGKLDSIAETGGFFCNIRVHSRVVLVAIIFDAFISISLLIIFVMNMWKYKENNPSVAKALKVNLALSTFMILFTTVSFITLATLNDSIGSLMAGTIALLNSFTNATCCCLITRKGWK